LGVACCKRPTHVVGLPRDVAGSGHAPTPNLVAVILEGEQGNMSVGGVLQVSLTELCEGLLGSPPTCRPCCLPWLMWTKLSSSGVRDGVGCPCGPHNAHTQTHGRGSPGTRGYPRSRNGAARPAAVWGKLGWCSPSQQSHPAAPREVYG
jgi:hypothetical protein